MLRKSLLFTLSSLLLTACGIIGRQEIVLEYDKVPMTRNSNVCTHLNDTVILYAIFVDVGIYHPWTPFDIASATDSIQKAADWIAQQAKDRGKTLLIKPIIHKQGSKQTIYERSARTSLSLNGIQAVSNRSKKKLGPWADNIAAYASRGIKYRASSKIHQRFRVRNVESLNLALRDKLKNNNVGIMFFVNGYYEKHASYSFNIENGPYQRVEYSIITDKNPAVIAHEFLHLFGAVDLYPHRAYPNFNFQELAENYPDEIMRIQHKHINKLMISPITEYFIGWRDTLDKPNTRLLLHKAWLPQY